MFLSRVVVIKLRHVCKIRPFSCKGLWVLAAKWEIEELNSMENARGLLQRGLRSNPKAKHIWLEVGHVSINS